MIGGGFGYGCDFIDIGNVGIKSMGDSYSFVLYGSYCLLFLLFVDGVVGFGMFSFDLCCWVMDFNDFVIGKCNGK